MPCDQRIPCRARTSVALAPASISLRTVFSHLDRYPIVDDGGSRPGVERVRAAREHRPVLLQHRRRVPVIPVDHRAHGPAGPRSRREDLTPGRRRGHPGRGHIDLPRFQLVEGLGQLAEGPVVGTEHVPDDHRHRPTEQPMFRGQSTNVRGQELMQAPQLIEHVADHRGIEGAARFGDQLGSDIAWFGHGLTPSVPAPGSSARLPGWRRRASASPRAGRGRRRRAPWGRWAARIA